jgi:hypothetical protein
MIERTVRVGLEVDHVRDVFGGDRGVNRTRDMGAGLV